jgi:hypothetical protein
MPARVRQKAFSLGTGTPVKLHELSAGYEAAAVRLRARLRILRARLRTSDDPQKRASLKWEIALLADILTQCNELAELTAHYYERGYYRNEKYTL